MNVTWSEEAIRALGTKTDVETAGAIFGMSRTQSYEAAKAGRFPVPVVPIGDHRLVVPVAPILRLLQIDADAMGETGPAAIDQDHLADMVAERVVSRLVQALTGTAADAVQRGNVPRLLRRPAAGDGPEAA